MTIQKFYQRSVGACGEQGAGEADSFLRRLFQGGEVALPADAKGASGSAFGEPTEHFLQGGFLLAGEHGIEEATADAEGMLVHACGAELAPVVLLQAEDGGDLRAFRKGFGKQ